MDATPVRIGDVSGPKAAVTDNNFASWDGVSGRLIKDSGSNASSFDTAGAAAAVQGTLDTHVGLTGTDVHGLGTMSTATATDYYTIAQSDTAYDIRGAADQVHTELGVHTNMLGTDVHGLGTIATQAANDVDLSGGTISGMTSIAATGQISTSSTAADSIETAGGIIGAGSEWRMSRSDGQIVSLLRSRGINSDTILRIDYPDVTSANAILDVFRDTNTSGICALVVRRGNGTTDRLLDVRNATPDSATADQVNIGNGRVDVGTKITVRGTAADSIETAGGVKAAGSMLAAHFRDQSTTTTSSTGDIDDLDTADHGVIQFIGSGSSTVTGLAGGVDGRVIRIIVGSSYTMTLSQEDSLSESDNRLRLGTDTVVVNNRGVTLQYFNGRWWMV